MLKILTLSSLYPNPVQEVHGVFVENRLRNFLRVSGAAARVVAPVPWFPLSGRRFGHYGALAEVPRFDERHGIPVYHPRYLMIPKLGMNLQPFTMALAVQPVLRAILNEGYEFDVIDSHYFYPDGVAAALLGRRLGKPVTITARGTDLNLIPRYAVPRRLIRWAAEQAAALITVSQGLKDRLVDLGVAPDRVTVLRNGVDLATFRPADRAAVRTRLGVEGPVVLSVGNLLPLKGHHLVIEALAGIPAATLLVVGEGPERGALEALARDRGLADRVRLLGRVPHDQLAEIYSAADVLVLASSREGWPNVLLESMACGTPVAACRVGGAPEVVTAPEAGILLDERAVDAVGAGIRRLLEAPPDRAATRAYAEGFDWDETARGLNVLFQDVVGTTYWG